MSTHAPDCASLPESKAAKILGPCYCDCGAGERQSWRLWEEVDGTCSVHPTGADPDDLSFSRLIPICVIPPGRNFAEARLIAAAPELLAALEEIAAENPDDISDRDELLRCVAIARAAIAKAQP